MVGRDGLRPITGGTIVTSRALWPELARARARGFAHEDREHAAERMLRGAPIFDRPGAVVAAIGLSAPALPLGGPAGGVHAGGDDHRGAHLAARVPERRRARRRPRGRGLARPDLPALAEGQRERVGEQVDVAGR